jgi:uncharacterized protein YndB with AHSA1/START domain
MSDYGVVTEPGTVRIQRVLPGPIERVWAYLTESEKRGTWLASGDMEPRVGGQVELRFRNSELSAHGESPPEKHREHACGGSQTDGRVTAWEPPQRLGYTWGGGSEVTFELTPREADVLLVLTHRRLGDRNEMLSVSAGWHAHLDILGDKLAGRETRPFWSTHARLEEEYAARIPAA